MILIDAHHLIHRIIFAAVSNPQFEKPNKGEKYNINLLKGIFLHMFFNNIKYLKDEFEEDYGEIIFCVDNKSWRKDIYPKYKSKRQNNRDNSTIDWKELYIIIDELFTAIDEYFPFKTVKVNKAEGDDIIAILAKHYSDNEDILIISEDKDMTQLKKYKNITIFKPIQKTIDKTSLEDAEYHINLHTLIGDKVDDIPSIKEETEFNLDFIKFLKQKDFYITNVSEAINMDILQKYQEEFGEPIYKKGMFGEVKAKKFLENLEINLDENPLYRKHFNRNKQLISFEYIPKDLEDKIIVEYTNKINTYNSNKMREYFSSNGLRKLIVDVDSFMPSNNINFKNSSSLNDWF